MFAKTIEPQAFAGWVKLSVRADLRVTVAMCPFGNIRVKAFPILNHWREQGQFATTPSFGLQPAAKFVRCLRLHSNAALGAKLGAEPGEEEPDEMINLGHGCDCALAAASACPLLDAD